MRLVELDKSCFYGNDPPTYLINADNIVAVESISRDDSDKEQACIHLSSSSYVKLIVTKFTYEQLKWALEAANDFHATRPDSVFYIDNMKVESKDIYADKPETKEN